MKKILKKILISLIVLSVLLSGGFAWLNRKFSTEAWIQTDNSKKYHYINDLTDNYDLIGMTSLEIGGLLGKPFFKLNRGEGRFVSYTTPFDHETDMIFAYRIREDLLKGWEIYLIRFKNHVVIKADIDHEEII